MAILAANCELLKASQTNKPMTLKDIAETREGKKSRRAKPVTNNLKNEFEKAQAQQAKALHDTYLKTQPARIGTPGEYQAPEVEKKENRQKEIAFSYESAKSYLLTILKGFKGSPISLGQIADWLDAELLLPVSANDTDKVTRMKKLASSGYQLAGAIETAYKLDWASVNAQLTSEIVKERKELLDDGWIDTEQYDGTVDTDFDDWTDDESVVDTADPARFVETLTVALETFLPIAYNTRLRELSMRAKADNKTTVYCTFPRWLLPVASTIREALRKINAPVKLVSIEGKVTLRGNARDVIKAYVWIINEYRAYAYNRQDHGL